MGEAKANRERLRNMFLQELDLWSFPASDEEREAVETVSRLPILAARRAPDEWLRRSNMPPRECHANVRWQIKNDPSGLSKQVLGWWRQGDHFVLHSVVGQGGDLMCITPQLRDVPRVFPFTPDPEIEGREEGDYIAYYRSGWRIPVGLRADPAATIRIAAAGRARLLAGASPWDVMRFIDAEHSKRLGI